MFEGWGSKVNLIDGRMKPKPPPKHPAGRTAHPVTFVILRAGVSKDAEARVICMANLTDYMEDIVSRLDIQPHTHDQTECD